MRQPIDDIALGYDLAGSGDAVLFLHAFPLTRRMWAPQVEALVGRARCLTVDFRGFGESDIPAGPYTLEDFADDVLALARRVGVSRATVVGLSMGGYVAFRLMARAPDFVQALVLADTRAEPDTAEGRERRLALAARVEREGFAAMDEFVRGLVGPTTRAERPAVEVQVGGIIGHPAPAAVAATLRALAARPDSRPMLGRIAVPTLVLVGEEDTLTPVESARVMAESIPQARLVILPRAGHLSNLESPDAFTTEVRRFLDRGAGEARAPTSAP